MPDTPRASAAPDTDGELEFIRSGDTDAFARWLAVTERPIRLSLRSFGAQVDTEAVLQETLLRVWNAAPHVRKQGPDSLLRYSITAARRVAIDEIRRAGHEVSLDAMEVTPDIEDPRPVAPDPFVRARIRDCFERLPTRPKAALAARMEDGGAHPDRVVARSRGMTLNTFHQNVGRARRLMAECLDARGVALP